jgi:O-antigen/teichoic acid export membrane protein
MSYVKAKLMNTLDLISKGHERSIKAKRNILISLIIKGLSISINLILVPLTITYINPSRYGIWLTLSSLVALFSFFDIGLSNGLRNKLAEAKAKGDIQLSQVYISTTYAILFIIFFSIWILFLICNNFLNWSRILNVPDSMKNEISSLAMIVFTYFCLSFVLKIITTILLADQRPALSSFIDLLGLVFSLIAILFLVKLTNGSLLKLGAALCVSPLLVLIGSNIYLFNGRYKNYKPMISKIDFFYAKDLINIGLVFFVIQVAYIIQYQTANIIIARNFSTLDVTSFNIVFKYFGVLTMIFFVFVNPFWSASTEAYNNNDIQWIRNGIRKYQYLSLFLVFLGFMMLVFSNSVYRFWLGKGNVNIDFSLSLFGLLFSITYLFGGMYVYFLNGISALRIQFTASLISPFLYIFIALILIKHFKFGVYSLFIASIIANFNTFLLAPLQYHKIMNKGKIGIWIR